MKKVEIRICKVCGKLCNDSSFISGMCEKHYQQYKKYGKPLDNNPRTVWDNNDIRVRDSYAEIDTYNSLGEVLVTYKVDIEDIPLLNNHKWRTVFKGKKNSPYLVTGHAGKQGNEMIYFHRLVMGNPISEIDHINRDSTDNRKANLRLANRSTQLANTSLRTDNVQGVKGVYYISRRGKYRAEIQKDSLHIYSPYYNSKEEAAYFRFLLEQLFYPNGDVHNSTMLISLVNSLTIEQRNIINTYFKNRAKAWV